MCSKLNYLSAILSERWNCMMHSANRVGCWATKLLFIIVPIIIIMIINNYYYERVNVRVFLQATN